MSAIIVRRRKLGRTSVREIVKYSTTGIRGYREDRMGVDAWNGVDLCIRWGWTGVIPGGRVLNSSEAIHQVNDKRGFRQVLTTDNLGPPTWFSCYDEGFYEDCYLRDGPVGQRFPLIIRPRVHAQGRQLHVCNTFDEVQIACADYRPGNYYISKLINKTAEYRVFIVQGRAVAVAQKIPSNPDDVAWNVARGGKFENVRWDNWPLKVVKKAINAFNLSSLDFGGVDVMVGQDNDAHVLEINSAPSLTSPYRQEAMAKAFDWIINNSKERIPLMEERGGYRKFIHPALTDRAGLI